jgi:mannose-6-phosphate isomerase class I
MSYLKHSPNYDKAPVVSVPGRTCHVGWDAVATRLAEARARPRAVLAVECYPGVDADDVLDRLATRLQPVLTIKAADAMLSPVEIDRLVEPFLGGDDPVFGYMTNVTLRQFFQAAKLAELERQIDSIERGLILVVGVGATLAAPRTDIVIYADLARWEAQQRFRRNEVGNLGTDNWRLSAGLKYKRAFFVDWPVADAFKKPLLGSCDFFLDTNNRAAPKLAAGETVRHGLRRAVHQPFRVVPIFDPAPWGGQWMKEVCDLDRSERNYGWCFDCVIEENSLYLGLGSASDFELPSLDLVLLHARELLGDAAHERFGGRFPIRFDLLDTMEGGELSLQVHPDAQYIDKHFGVSMPQDESYYLLDVDDNASVYLGLKTDVEPAELIAALETAQAGGSPVDVERFVNRWPARKHDHFLIPAGTIHCSGKNALVLEISAAPYIFTFKLWDWGRPGLDGRPRPIHLEHGKHVLRFDRNSEWTKRELINRIQPLARGDGWSVERTGLHELEFLDTHRQRFTKAVPHCTDDSVNVLNLVEGREAIVESPNHSFAPLVIHYAETFIIPASVGEYTIRPHGLAASSQCATIKAFVRCGQNSLFHVPVGSTS